MWFISDFSLSKRVQNVCKSSYVQLRDIKHVMAVFFLLMMLLHLWPLLLLEVSWIIIPYFFGVSLSSTFINYSASKIVQLELYQIQPDKPV